MSSLYKIDERISQALDEGWALDEETGEVYQGTSGLEALQMERAEKLEACGLWLKDKEALAEAMRREEDALRSRRVALENRVERVKEYVAGSMQASGEKTFETARVKLSTRKTERVEVMEGAALPGELVKVTVKTVETPDKAAIKARIKAGFAVPGARLVEGLSLRAV